MQTSHNISLEDLDRRSSLHPFTSIADHLRTGPRIMVKGKGVYVTDSKGRDYIDAAAGLWCVNIGHGRDEVADAIYAQARELAFFHYFSSMATEPAIRLADRLVQLAPGNMSKVYFGLSGSDANDAIIKLIWYYNNLRGLPEKKKIIARLKGYHGATLGAGSLTGLPLLHERFDLPLPQIKHASAACYYWGAEAGMSERDYALALAYELDDLIEAEGPQTVAAFIAEPVMGTGGVLVPPEGYFDEVRRVLDRHDVLLVADEVICGFGRLGSWFGSLRYGIEPDFMTIGKGLTSGYQPMSGSMISEKIWRVLLEHSPDTGPLAIGHTYTAHPCAAAAAMANLDIIEREDLVGNAVKVGAHLDARLKEAFSDHPLVGEVRCIGLMAGVELVAERKSKQPFGPDQPVARRVMQRGCDEGVLLRALPNGNCLGISPPLCITRDEVDALVERFAAALDRVTDELAREGVLDYT